MTRILLLEDDASLIDGLEYALRKNDFHVETVRTVKEALNRLNQSTDTSAARYDLLLLDVTLPDGTGFEVCEMAREKDPLLPIIFLTASDEEVNVIRGLDSGADDYITKPFKIGELNARIRALLRRAGGSSDTDHASSTIASGGIVIDLAANRVTLHGKPLPLTRAEYRLLSLLMQNAGRVVTREIILDKLWDENGDFVDDNTLSVYVRRLREKIERDPSHPEHLVTVRGFGYRFESLTKI
ncbi:MAG: response regulator transcription factor [Bacteroidales bacterium]|nr:response regulator transcription factor [Bacteroidales bacterium]MCM1415380.1 response regulator transcription factor [bacterium]MCM1423313.1 response regulator transcription factor [bacterium]